MRFHHILLCIFLFVMSSSFGQTRKYVLLGKQADITNRGFEDYPYCLTTLLLETDFLYKRPHYVELYNFLFPKHIHKHESLVLFSILPDFKDGTLWKEIKDTTILADAIPPIDLQYLFTPYLGYVEGMKHMQRKFMNEYVLVKKEQGKYYFAPYCLMELFEYRAINPIFNSSYGALNPREEIVTITDFIKASEVKDFDAVKSFYPGMNEVIYSEGWRSWKEYLSKNLIVNGEKAYQYWTFAPDNQTHGYSYATGINRFVYLPGKGIIAGSYDFFFRTAFPGSFMQDDYAGVSNGLSAAEWEQNILEEKLIWAKDFKID